jgi:single-stranded-DNA-specific exonuclease
LAAVSKRWYVIERVPEEYFSRFPDLAPVIVQILHNRRLRGAQEVRDFLGWRPTGSMDPFQLKGMTQAVERLWRAIRDGDLIAVYGDYDVDGVTATALMVQTLTALGARVEPYIPNRFDEGYGLNTRALTRLAGKGTKVVLTVDCGIRSVNEVVHGNRLGLDMILTDHHSIGADMPPALAAINPKQPDCSYPFKQLAGVGLAFKLAQALLQEMGRGRRKGGVLCEEDLLDLVALGTVADLAPLMGENRTLVARGLEQLNAPRRPGVQTLLAQTNLLPGKVGASSIGFGLGPRLNAAGRLESAVGAYELLVTHDIFRAGQLAQQLETQNRERQVMTQAAVEQARQVILDDDGRHPLYIIDGPAYNTGIVGLVSSRLTEEFYRPTLVARRGHVRTQGSARSIPEFHITHALDECAGLLERYGGHSVAAGFTLKNDNVAALKARLLDIAERELAGRELVPTLEIDAKLNLRGIRRRRVEDLLSGRAAGRAVDDTDVGLRILDGLAQLQPCGAGNPEPVFISQGLEVKGKRLVGVEGKHLKLVLSDGRQIWHAIAFRMGSWHDVLSDRVDLAYTLEINEWNGRQRLQLNVKDIRPAEA